MNQHYQLPFIVSHDIKLELLWSQCLDILFSEQNISLPVQTGMELVGFPTSSIKDLETIGYAAIVLSGRLARYSFEATKRLVGYKVAGDIIWDQNPQNSYLYDVREPGELLLINANFLRQLCDCNRPVCELCRYMRVRESLSLRDISACQNGKAYDRMYSAINYLRELCIHSPPSSFKEVKKKDLISISGLSRRESSRQLTKLIRSGVIQDNGRHCVKI